MLEKLFKLKENHTTVKTEILAGITTFMTMAYILAVNPSVLGATGMDQGAIFTATVLAAVLGTVCMALFANYPFALAPGMGLNAYFAYTVVIGMGYPWQAALAAVFVEGVIFILLSLFNIREAIFNSIPTNLKKAVSVGIGFFIAFIGLQNAKIVVGGATLVEFFSLDAVEGGTMHDVGITVFLAILGVLITSVLVIKNVKGNILWGILATWILGIICQLTGIYVPNPEIGFYNLLPDFSAGISIPSLAPIFCKLNFTAIPFSQFIVIVFAFLFVDMFDTLGTLIGVASKADMLDKDGKLPNIKGALTGNPSDASPPAVRSGRYMCSHHRKYTAHSDKRRYRERQPYSGKPRRKRPLHPSEHRLPRSAPQSPSGGSSDDRYFQEPRASTGCTPAYPPAHAANAPPVPSIDSAFSTE